MFKSVVLLKIGCSPFLKLKWFFSSNYHSEQEKKNHQPVDMVDEKLVQKVLEDSKTLKTSSNGETKGNQTATMTSQA